MATKPSGARSNKEIADELELISGQLPGEYARQALRLVDELGGAKYIPTDNEVRNAELARQYEAEAKAAQKVDTPPAS